MIEETRKQALKVGKEEIKANKEEIKKEIKKEIKEDPLVWCPKTDKSECAVFLEVKNLVVVLEILVKNNVKGVG